MVDDMTEYKKLIERREQIISDHFNSGNSNWVNNIARAIFTADAEDGYVLVKREVTEVMLRAYLDSLRQRYDEEDSLTTAIAAGEIREDE